MVLVDTMAVSDWVADMYLQILGSQTVNTQRHMYTFDVLMGITRVYDLFGRHYWLLYLLQSHMYITILK